MESPDKNLDDGYD